MKRNLKCVAGAVFFSWLVIAQGQEELHGVFSNEAQEFQIATLVIHESGYAYFHAAVAGVIGEWSFDKTTSVLTVRVPNPEDLGESSVSFLFDPEQRSYTFIDPSYSSYGKAGTLHYITNVIPERLVAAFKEYPAALQEHRARLKAREEQKRKLEERLAREQPEYERIRTAIVSDPAIVLSEEFHGREDTPATRAFKSTLADRTVHYPESVLVDLLDKLPPDNHWIREMIFTRPELSAETIEKFYPKALEWGKHLNYSILANIAEHPNTPRHLVEDLANRKGLPLGATGPAQRRLKRLQNDEAPSNTPVKTQQPTDAIPEGSR